MSGFFFGVSSLQNYWFKLTLVQQRVRLSATILFVKTNKPLLSLTQLSNNYKFIDKTCFIDLLFYICRAMSFL
jgi:hypothetical protein